MRAIIAITALFSLTALAHTINYYPNAPLEIIQIGHPTLALEAEPYLIEDIASDDTQDLIDDMMETMKKAGGVGLAAPQVNVSKRLFVMKPSMFKKAQAVINPVVEYIVEAGKKKSKEGCLSIPGKTYTVSRFKEINTQYYNRHGDFTTEMMKGFKAIVFQHEYDHLNGTLIADFLFPIEVIEEEYDESAPKM